MHDDKSIMMAKEGDYEASTFERLPRQIAFYDRVDKNKYKKEKPKLKDGEDRRWKGRRKGDRKKFYG